MSDDKMELARVGSLCVPDPQIQLLDAWTSRDFPTFCDLLKQPGVSADHWYDDPHLATCLYLTCKEEDGAQYASALLEAGAQPNNLNRIRKKAPIHVAAEFARVEVLKVLLSNPSTDVNIMDNFGNTALHLIAKQKLKNASEETVNKYKHCIRLLMNQSGINVNTLNRKGYTAVHLGAQNDATEMVHTILVHAGDDLDVDSFKAPNGKTGRDTILEKCPEFASLLPEHGRVTKKTIDSSTLFQCLYHRDFDSFSAAINLVPNVQLDKSDGSRTLLQYCAENGLERPAIALLDRGVNPNGTCLAEPRPPALLACYGGHPAILILFLRGGSEFVDLETAVGGEGTAFHAVLNSQRADTLTVHRDYKTCLDMLLKYLPKLKIDINAVDLRGNTALHYAAKNEDDYAVFTLLKHGAYIGIKNVFGEPPLANMTPKMLEASLDECLDTNGEFPREDAFEVTFSYKFLVPPPGQCCMPEKQNSNSAAILPLHNSKSPCEPPTLIPTATTNTETEPLLYISKSRDLRHLLKHPVFTSFLDLKWHRIRIYFYINLIFYLLFVTSLTIYILCNYGKSQIINSNRDSDNTSVINRSIIDKSRGESLTVVKGNVSGFWWVLSVLLLILLMLRELFQLVVSPSKYFRSPENYLEILLLITSASILFSDWVRNSARPHFSAIAILLSWAELVLLIGRHPRLSTNIEMFKTVSWNFLKFLAWYAILIIAFALSFYTLFRDCSSATGCSEGEGSDENFFLNPGMSVFKTTVMLTGEFDTASIPFVSIPGTSHIVFVLFIFLIAIVLFNLLNGLAVSDTQAIRDDAEVVSYISRVKLLSHIEALFQSFSLPFLDTLKRICCCWPMGNNSLKSITSRVCLFPHKVPHNKIRVLPNQGSRIIFTSHQIKRHEEEEGIRCCPEGCSACTLDSGILKRAIQIINNRGKFSEIEEVRTLLTISQKKLEEYDRKFDSLEKSWKETEAMLGRILNTLLQHSPSNSSLNK
jgi:ankyrin repeat protein